MGSSWADSGAGRSGENPSGQRDADGEWDRGDHWNPGGQWDPGETELVVELVDESDGRDGFGDLGDFGDFGGPNSPGAGDPHGDPANSATSDRETIAGASGDDRPGARVLRLPRAVRVLGVVVLATVLALTVWPAPPHREAALPPSPAPTTVSEDLYKVQLDTTTLQTDSGADHAVLGLELTNNATKPLEVVSAELWDAVGTRIGSSSIWPARQGLDAQSTESVPVTVPYACDGSGFVPVLPLMVRYSISTPQAPNVRHDYSSPLTAEIWDTYTRQRAWRCGRPDAELSASAIDTSQPIGAPADPQGFELTFAVETAGTGNWEVSVADSADANPVATVTGAGLPVLVRPGQIAHITTHWHLVDCTQRPGWYRDLNTVKFTAQLTDPPPGTGEGAQETFYAELRPGLVQEMLLLACGG